MTSNRSFDGEKGRIFMGLLVWMHRRRARSIIRAMWKHYSEGRAQYSDVEESEICRATIGSRFQIIKPGTREMNILSSSLNEVQNIYQACALVIRAETNISIGVDNELWVALCVVIANEVATLKNETSPDNIKNRINELIAFIYDTEKASNQ